jgi:hypothetical protein
MAGLKQKQDGNEVNTKLHKICNIYSNVKPALSPRPSGRLSVPSSRDRDRDRDHPLPNKFRFLAKSPKGGETADNGGLEATGIVSCASYKAGRRVAYHKPLGNAWIGSAEPPGHGIIRSTCFATA